MSAPLAVMLVSGAQARLLAGLTLAAGGLAMGRETRVFVTGEALVVCLPDYHAAEDDRLAGLGLAGVAGLRDACLGMGATWLACDSALHATGLAPEALLPGIEVGGIPALIEGGLTPAVF